MAEPLANECGHVEFALRAKSHDRVSVRPDRPLTPRDVCHDHRSEVGAHFVCQVHLSVMRRVSIPRVKSTIQESEAFGCVIELDAVFEGPDSKTFAPRHQRRENVGIVESWRAVHGDASSDTMFRSHPTPQESTSHLFGLRKLFSHHSANTRRDY